jgi:hypothetical protein
MANLCVSYELNRGDKKDYSDLLAALERFEDRCHALESVWFICTPRTAHQVYAFLRRYLDPQDTLLVEELPVLQGWSGWVRQDVRDWLLDHLGPPS